MRAAAKGNLNKTSIFNATDAYTQTVRHQATWLLLFCAITLYVFRRFCCCCCCHCRYCARIKVHHFADENRRISETLSSNAFTREPTRVLRAVPTLSNFCSYTNGSRAKLVFVTREMMQRQQQQQPQPHRTILEWLFMYLIIIK